MKYEIIYHPIKTNEIICIKKIDNNTEWFIPIDESNSDYQAYLAWLAEQDEVTN